MPADLAVIGLGHLGLPLAQAATAAGLRTVGFDPDPDAVAELRAGRPPVEGSLSAAEVRRMVSRDFQATTDPAALGRVRTAAICAPTPLGEDRALDLTAVGEAARTLAPRLGPHTTVLLESTVYPGTTEEFLRPLLEEGSGLRAGRDFHLAYAPGRLDPGNRTYSLANTPKVIGGLTPACTEAAAAFYGRLAEKVVRARGPREAEMVKVLETNYRHVNIALVNEMAVFCHDLGIDLWDVIRCAETKPFGFHAFRPGPGVGGHGVPIDPNYLTYQGRSLGYPLRMVELAQEVNGRMPRYVTQRCATLLNEHGKSARGARVLLLGVSYKADVADQEGSPAREIASRLLELGAQLSYHDPHVPQWRVLGQPVPRADSLYEAAAAADLTVLLQPHRTYDLQGLAVKAQLLLDTRGASPAGAAHRL
ncbi:nucleotide sugar dehydrogenase [Streptomyces sp. SAJ15]|uniref:nucleotide sugar dehydrogenase n=1 Tax=Streptomyces sp. SAJ15 TaxID=2011095 RepID=UPI001185BC80|nr:nucleotide sugar dehydrogenase [Streptomyces sp. SAJ15]TVL93705.1 UDP-N-acetyl-D-glucosamine dehydrogenase [Streptomyces sp. SAJ15]